jgi:hypothetical protein
MTNEEIHNIYLHMSGKAEGLAEATGSADFPVMFARAILEFARMHRAWQWLTAEEINALYIQHHNQFGECLSGDWGYERDLEAKLKEKNG